MVAQLIAVVAEGCNGRVYLSPSSEHQQIALCKEPQDAPTSELPEKALGFRVQAYGMTRHKDLFTNRQLTALTTFSGLVAEAQKKAEADALAAGLPADQPLADGGIGAKAYGQAVGVYLSFIISKLADRGSSICSWDVTRDGIRNTFGRQAIPMVWDYAEANPFSNSSGCFDNMLEWVFKCVANFPAATTSFAHHSDAQKSPDHPFKGWFERGPL